MSKRLPERTPALLFDLYLRTTFRPGCRYHSQLQEIADQLGCEQEWVELGIWALDYSPALDGLGLVDLKRTYRRFQNEVVDIRFEESKPGYHRYQQQLQWLLRMGYLTALPYDDDPTPAIDLGPTKLSPNPKLKHLARQVFPNRIRYQLR